MPAKPHVKPIPFAVLCLSLLAPLSHAGNGRDGTTLTASANAGIPQPAPKIYKYMVGGVTTFSDLAPSRGSFVVLDFSCYACNPASKVNWQATRLHTDKFSDMIDDAARRYNIDPALVRAVIHAESGFNTQARSPKGAMGLMQLMPATARELGVTNAWQPAQNIRGGVQYLAGLMTRFRGNTTLATAAYNAGPGAVEKHRGVPPYAETQAYVKRVDILRQRYQLTRQH